MSKKELVCGACPFLNKEEGKCNKHNKELEKDNLDFFKHYICRNPN